MGSFRVTNVLAVMNVNYVRSLSFKFSSIMILLQQTNTIEFIGGSFIREVDNMDSKTSWNSILRAFLLEEIAVSLCIFCTNTFLLFAIACWIRQRAGRFWLGSKCMDFDEVNFRNRLTDSSPCNQYSQQRKTSGTSIAGSILVTESKLRTFVAES